MIQSLYNDSDPSMYQLNEIDDSVPGAARNLNLSTDFSLAVVKPTLQTSITPVPVNIITTPAPDPMAAIRLLQQNMELLKTAPEQIQPVQVQQIVETAKTINPEIIEAVVKPTLIEVAESGQAKPEKITAIAEAVLPKEEQVFVSQVSQIAEENKQLEEPNKIFKPIVTITTLGKKTKPVNDYGFIGTAFNNLIDSIYNLIYKKYENG